MEEKKVEKKDEKKEEKVVEVDPWDVIKINK
jgi:hypothetical protein